MPISEIVHVKITLEKATYYGQMFTKQAYKIWLNSSYVLLWNHNVDVEFFSVTLSFVQRFLNSMLDKRLGRAELASSKRNMCWYVATVVMELHKKLHSGVICNHSHIRWYEYVQFEIFTITVTICCKKTKWVNICKSIHKKEKHICVCHDSYRYLVP